jgi:hypothetical protein
LSIKFVPTTLSRIDFSSKNMGGGRRFEYPKHVWSPAGGWWANPTHWKRNTAIYIGVAGFILYSINEATKSKIVSSIVIQD